MVPLDEFSKIAVAFNTTFSGADGTSSFYYQLHENHLFQSFSLSPSISELDFVAPSALSSSGLFFYLTSVIFYITVIANHSNHRLVIWLILANSSGLALSSCFSNSKLNYCCFWYYTSSFERIVSYILFSSYVCTSTFNYPWQILKQYQYNFSGLLQLS